VLADYRNSRCRCIFLDNEGTLAPEAGKGITPYGNIPLRKDGNSLDPQVMDCLRLLSKDPLNCVVVLSGRSPEFLDRVQLSKIEGLGICAEYGFYYLDPGRIEQANRKGGGNEVSDRWRCASASTTEDADWKEVVFELMKMYAKRVQGSIIEYKGAAISWNYREVGAQLVAKEMALELMRFLDPDEPGGLMRGYPVTVSAGKGYVEVGRSDINKGISVKRVIAEIQKQIGNPDFILCIGDDRSDEHMFEAVSEYSQSAVKAEKRQFNSSANSLGAGLSSPRLGDGDVQPNASAFAKQLSKKASMTIEALEEAEKSLKQRFYTVTVGRKRSKAGYFVQNVDNVSQLLTQLTAQTTKAQFSRFQSMPNLAGAMSPDASDED